ncbi:MAG TPA: PDZ domain-containing protein, partial [Candidatus Sulfotelmatobacter sp.]|nr:PDZ domain-containing protein [Candidatus Sulfotelmatobacter sp.]
MRSSFSPRRLLRRLLAIVFAASATTYSVLWIVQTKYTTPQPGFTNYEYSASTCAMQVGEVLPGSPAEQSGLHSGDRIVAIDGQILTNLRPFYEAIIAGHKNSVELTVEEPGLPAGQRQLQLIVAGGRRVPEGIVRPVGLLRLPLDYYPVCFLVVGVAVLLLRPDDRNAWLLAVLFGGFLADAPLFEGNIPPLLRGFAVCYKIAMMWSSLALFYYFFAVFPARSPID